MEHCVKSSLFEAIVANPQQRLSDLPLLTEFEQHQLLREWNNTEIEYHQQQYIHELFEAQVDKTPDAIALVFEDQQLSYRELNQRANRLAHYLRSLGVKSEVLVGICVERSPLMLIGLLGILKAGGAYVQIDPSYPLERKNFILNDSQMPVLLTQQHLIADLDINAIQVVCIDSHWQVINQQQTTLTIPDLRGFLESKLPNYMVPAAFVTLEALPLTPNGKVDYKALPAPDTVRPELEVVYQPPQTEIEKTIADIWQEVLHIENVGINDNFFELGGHSLLLVQVHSKLQKIFQKDVLLVEMFQHPTVSHLAKYFSQESREETSFIQHSHRSESRKASTQRRKQARKEHRAATKEKGVSSQSGE
jgi:acyl carrier protein